MAMVATSCGDQKIEYVDGDVIHDTLPKDTTITIKILGVNTIQICSDKSTQTVKFDATGDWTWTPDAKASWMTATELKGTKGEGKIEFKVTENTGVTERRATTILKMDGHDNKLTFVQKGMAPYVEIYAGKITLGPDMTEAYVTNIVSNVELKVTSHPTWIESVIVESLDDYPDANQALVTLMPWDFNDAAREDGIIRFEGANDPSVFIEYKISCAAFITEYFVDPLALAGEPGQVDTLPGAGVDKISGEFVVYANPAPVLADFTVVLLENFYGTFVYSDNMWAQATKLSSRTAYTKTTVEIVCQKFTQGGDKVRSAGVFVVPTADVEAFITAVKDDPNSAGAPNFVFSQSRYDILEELTGGNFPSYAAGVPSQGKYTYRVRQGNKFVAKMTYGSKGGNPVDATTFTVSEPVNADGWDTYVITVTYDGTTDEMELGYMSSGFEVYSTDADGNQNSSDLGFNVTIS